MKKKIEYAPSCWLIQDDEKLTSHAEHIKKCFQRAIKNSEDNQIAVKLKRDSDTEATMIRIDLFFGREDGFSVRESASRTSLVQYTLTDESSVEYIVNKLNNALSHMVALSAIETIY